MPRDETDAEFLERLKAIAQNWRYSDEFVGIVFRTRWPKDYSDIGRQRRPVEWGPDSPGYDEMGQ